MKRIFLAAVMAAMALPCMAVDWVCSASSTTRIAIAAADLPDGATGSGAALMTRKSSVRSVRKLDMLDLVQAYSGQPLLLGNTWLLVVMLPSSHPDTRAAFGELGLSPEAAERLANSSGIVDRGIRVVQSPSQMIDKVASNHPAVGYTGFFAGGRDVARCF